MCDPVTATVMGVAQAGMSIQGQKIQAKTQRITQRNASEQERKRYLAEVSSSRLQQRQNEVAAAQKNRQIARESMRAQATTRASAGESGVAGLSIDALVDDIKRQEGQAQFSITQQTSFEDAARERALETSGLGFTSNILRINKPIQKVNYLGAALEGAQTGMSFYSAGTDMGLTMPWAKD